MEWFWHQALCIEIVDQTIAFMIWQSMQSKWEDKSKLEKVLITLEATADQVQKEKERVQRKNLTP